MNWIFGNLPITEVSNTFAKIHYDTGNTFFLSEKEYCPRVAEILNKEG